jgi:hypothetical protein
MRRRTIRFLVYLLVVLTVVDLTVGVIGYLSFTSRLLFRPETVVIFGYPVPSLVQLLTRPVILGAAVIIAGAIGLFLARRDQPIQTSVSNALYRVGEVFDVLPLRNVAVRGCVVHAKTRWIADYNEDGRIDIQRRECPACALTLHETHVPAIETDTQTIAYDQTPEYVGALFSGIVRDRTGTRKRHDNEQFVSALACPECAFTVREFATADNPP